MLTLYFRILIIKSVTQSYSKFKVDFIAILTLYFRILIIKSVTQSYSKFKVDFIAMLTLYFRILIIKSVFDFFLKILCRDARLNYFILLRTVSGEPINNNVICSH